MKKGHRKAQKILCRIAKQEGVTVEYVVESIEKAIQAAYLRAQIMGDLHALSMWEQIPKIGEFPSVLDTIEYMGEKFRKM